MSQSSATLAFMGERVVSVGSIWLLDEAAGRYMRMPKTEGPRERLDWGDERAAACALAAAGFSEDEMRAVTIGDVDPTDLTVTRTRDGVATAVPMPAGAEVHVRTQLLLRVGQGATHSGLLFAMKDGSAVKGRRLVYAVTAPITEMGISLLHGNLNRTPPSPHRWANRWGVSVQAL